MIELSTLLLFGAAVLPLVCTPGPDLLYVAAQALTGGHKGAIRANAGVISGYVAHAALGALGVAAVVAAWPLLFEGLRWIGIGYLAYLALQMFRSMLRAETGSQLTASKRESWFKGFLTSFLNPKGLLVYFAILPNFINPQEAVALQALSLSAVFIGLCAIVYGAVGVGVTVLRGNATGSDGFRRKAEGIAGGMLAFAAYRMSTR